MLRGLATLNFYGDATRHGELTERGHGFVTASVVDPFGNVLGVMYNPHYLAELGSA